MLESRAGAQELEPGVDGWLSRLRPSWVRQTRRRDDAAAILESLDPAVVGRGVDGVVTAWNSGAERLYGYSAEEMIGERFEIIVPSARRHWEAEAIKASLLARLSDTYDTDRLSKDGAAKEVRVQISPIKDSAGAVVGVSTIECEAGPDFDDDRCTPGVEAFLRSAFEDAPIGMALVSIDPAFAGRFLRVNRALCELTGYPPESLTLTNVRALLHPEDAATDLAAMTKLGSGELDGFQLEQRLLHFERHVVWVMVNVSLVRDAEGNPLYCIRQLQDIGERKRYEGELGYLVEHDPLTGLLNRRGFVRELTHEMAYSRRYGGDGAVLFLDLDDFKWVNDTLDTRSETR